MAGGPVINSSASTAHGYKGSLNTYVFIVAMVAASGGLLFGYDIGVTGGVMGMDDFEKKFFPDVYAASTSNSTDSDDAYCTYSDQELQLFTSSLFLAGLFISIPASYVTNHYGRKLSMIAAGSFFLLGSGLNAGAENLAMLVVGRIFLGFGIGFGNQVVPLYLSEQAPAHIRGALNLLFQLMVTIGILVAQLINYFVADTTWGWRFSLGFAAVPAVIMLLGGIFLPESPNSLLERGYESKGRAVLEKLRGTTDVDAEFEDIKEAVKISSAISTTQSWKAQFSRKYLPMFIVTISIAALQQLTGINAIMFYAPSIFSSLGSSESAALLNTVIIGGVNIIATFISIFTIDRYGRKSLFIEGGVQMALALTAAGILLGVEFTKYTSATLPVGICWTLLIIICIFVAAFAWSWGPLGWCVPSEIQTLETRAAGMGSAVCVNFLFSFIIGQAFLSMLCGMQYGVFLFFASWVVVMTVFVIFLYSETKGVPIERIPTLFAKHKVWKKVLGADNVADILARKQSMNASFKAKSVSEGSDY